MSESGSWGGESGNSGWERSSRRASSSESAMFGAQMSAGSFGQNSDVPITEDLLKVFLKSTEQNACALIFAGNRAIKPTFDNRTFVALFREVVVDNANGILNTAKRGHLEVLSLLTQALSKKLSHPSDAALVAEVMSELTTQHKAQISKLKYW